MGFTLVDISQAGFILDNHLSHTLLWFNSRY